MTTNNDVAQPAAGVELKACPLAHPVDKGLNIHSSSGMRKWHIWCFDCGLQFEGRLDETARELFARWNTRTPADVQERARRATRRIVNALPYEVAQHVNRGLMADIIAAEFGGGVASENKMHEAIDND